MAGHFCNQKSPTPGFFSHMVRSQDGTKGAASQDSVLKAYLAL